MLNTILRGRPVARAATVFTIHNLEYQGYGPKNVMDYAHLPMSEFRADSIESHGQVNMMKAGLYHSTKLTTVSPTYAQEVRTPAGGFGLDQVLRYRGADLLGIVNGIDTATWNPATDKVLPANYSASAMAGKGGLQTGVAGKTRSRPGSIHAHLRRGLPFRRPERSRYSRGGLAPRFGNDAGAVRDSRQR